MTIVLKLNMKTAKRLSYAVGRSDEANNVVQAAMQAAKVAEQNVRDLVSLIADAAGEKLPPNFGIKFDEDSNDVTITSQEPMPSSMVELPAGLRTNGIQKENN